MLEEARGLVADKEKPSPAGGDGYDSKDDSGQADAVENDKRTGRARSKCYRTAGNTNPPVTKHKGLERGQMAPWRGSGKANAFGSNKYPGGPGGGYSGGSNRGAASAY